jgi:hypothetical protein
MLERFLALETRRDASSEQVMRIQVTGSSPGGQLGWSGHWEGRNDPHSPGLNLSLG